MILEGKFNIDLRTPLPVTHNMVEGGAVPRVFGIPALDLKTYVQARLELCYNPEVSKNYAMSKSKVAVPWLHLTFKPMPTLDAQCLTVRWLPT